MEKPQGLKKVPDDLWLKNDLHMVNKVLDLASITERQVREFHINGQLASILSSIIDPVVVVDRNWRFTFLNKAAEARLPYDASDILERSVWDIFPQYGMSELAKQAGKAMSQRVSIHTGIVNQHGDWVELSIYPHQDGLLALWYPNPERATRKENDYSDETFYQVFRQSPHIMAINRLEDGIYIDVNDSFIRASGCRREEIIGHTPYDVGLWMNGDNRREIICALQSRGMISNYELDIRTKSGSIRVGFFSGVVLEIDREPCMLFSLVDVTERKRAEESLRMSEERFRKIVHSSQNMMVVSRLSDRRCLDVNESWIRYTGYSREEAVGRTAEDLHFYINPEDLTRIDQQIHDKGKIDNYELQYCSKTGEIRVALLSMDLIDINRERCLLGILNDITERKRLENEVARLERLQLVGDMAASMAHEIRNPLTTVRGFLQMFANRKEYSADQETLNLVIEELDRANVIISEYLSLANDDEGEFKKKSLNDLLTNLYPVLLSQAAVGGQRLQLELGYIRELMLDENEICQLIFNLIQNSIEATLPGGEVVVRTYSDKNEVVLSIHDQGSGIDLELIKRIGIPVCSTKENGSGLGLAICYRIAMRHNAVIEVETSSDGTTFFVRFR